MISEENCTSKQRAGRETYNKQPQREKEEEKNENNICQRVKAGKTKIERERGREREREIKMETCPKGNERQQQTKRRIHTGEME